MSYTREQIAAQCRASGPDVTPLPAGVEGAQLLWALSGNESSFGFDVTPRYESAYDSSGVYGENPVMRPLLAEYGSAAAYSYGPWQVMFCNVPSGWAPEDMAELPKAARATVLFLNSLLKRFRPRSLVEIGECWNAGHTMPIPPPAVARYVAELSANYGVALPNSSA